MADSCDKVVLALVGAEGFRGVQIVMVTASGRHSVALGAEGRVWIWWQDDWGQLVHNNQENLPTLLADEALGRAAGVLVSGGWEVSHSDSHQRWCTVDLGTVFGKPQILCALLY